LNITSVQLRNFKSYAERDFTFEREGALIVGKNGIGKTNLLEAMSYFSYGKSILKTSDKELVRFGAGHFFLRSVYHINEADTLFTVFFEEGKKVVTCDQKPQKRLSDLYSLVQIIYSAPEDIYNIFTTPLKRRQFLDMAILKVFPGYIDIYRRFRLSLSQRNALLRTDFTAGEKEAWDFTFAKDSFEVCEYRLRFIAQFEQYLKEAYQMIIAKKEGISITLRQSFFSDGDYVLKLVNKLQDNLARERKYQQTVVGPHQDDFDIYLDGKRSLLYASQGQKRSIVIALKIALANLIKNIYNKNPILCFDDTLAELDKDRRTQLLTRLIPEHQIFIASPEVDKYLSSQLPVLELT